MKCKKCEKKIEICEDCGDPIIPKREPWKFPENKIRENMYPCLHENCSGCRNGTCSGVHMISCPCPKCSPRM